MNILYPLIIFVAIILIILIYKIIKGLLKLAFFITIVFLIGAIVFSYFLIQDMKTANQNIYVLRDDEKFIAGFVIEGLNTSTIKTLDRIPEDFEGNLFIFNKSALSGNDFRSIKSSKDFATYITGKLKNDSSLLLKEFKKGNLAIYPKPDIFEFFENEI